MEFEDNITYQKALRFAINTVEEYKTLTKKRKEYVMSKQLLKSGTSIGANVAESKGAISRADYSAKISIAYKECLETKYWLRILKQTDYLGEESFKSMYSDADELGRILFSIIRTTRL